MKFLPQLKSHGLKIHRYSVMTEPLDFRIGNIITLKKLHPCGSSQWEIVRIGMDIRIRCFGCGRRVLMVRRELERQIKSIT